MKLIQSIDEALGGREKAAFKLGKTAGDAGKPSLTKAAVNKSFGDGAWEAYNDGYLEGKNRYQSKEDHDAWKEKDAARRQGRNYHE